VPDKQYQIKNKPLERDKKNNFKKILRFTSIPFEMFIIIFGFYKLGEFVDDKYPNENSIYSIIFILSGVFISMGYIIWRVKKIF